MAADITAAMVKKLRENTDAPMMDCKKALVEAEGDFEQAREILVKLGNKKAAKTVSRIAAQGRVVIAANKNAAAMMEINCETDFVAKDESFVQFSKQIAEKMLDGAISSTESLLAADFDGKLSGEEARKNLVARLGENIQIRRLAEMKPKAGQHLGHYVHNARIGTLVVIEGGSEALAKDLAMHVAAMKPEYISFEDVPETIVAKHKAIMMESAQQSGKPDNIIEKIVQGQLHKYFSELCLTGQPFFKDPDQSIAQILKAQQAKVLDMIRFEVGEGIEVIKKSFEEEVMAQARGSNT